MLVSRSDSVLSFSIVAGSIFAKASSVGAKTVNWPLLSVSIRFTLGLSLPDSADVSVFSIGLLDAATVTGSWAMPATEPGPLGTCSAYVAQPAPTRLAAGSALAVVGAAEGDMELLVATEELVADELLSFEHPDTPSTASAARLAAESALWW